MKLTPTRPAPLSTTVPAAALAALVGLGLAGCTENSPSSAATSGSGAASPGDAGSAGQPGTITVQATDTECTLSANSSAGGTITFDVRNTGSQVTEFYLLGSDKQRIVGEVENISPGLERRLVLTAPAGDYYSSCKPGMVGEGIVAPFTVTAAAAGSGASPTNATEQAQIAAATKGYAEYVRGQSDELMAATKKFATAYASGDDATARALYATARQPWERIETVAESFGDLDPKVDAREADVEAGSAWTGWHVAEKDLWAPKGFKGNTAAQRTKIADQLVADTTTLHTRIASMTFTLDQIGNGAKGLLDEVATKKVTGEEEIFSHTDLYDIQANVDGSKKMWTLLRPLLKAKDATLDGTIEQRFTALQALLDQHRKGTGFADYTTLTPTQVKGLSDAVNALSEPLSKVTGVVLNGAS